MTAAPTAPAGRKSRRGWRTIRPKSRIFALTAALALVATGTLVGAGSARAATVSFSAHGSAEQVWVTGLPSSASMTLLDAHGRSVATQQADSQGGLLFRNVTPGNGYRVRVDPNGPESDPITVHSDAAAPWDPGIYNQPISDSGYQYLTTRDGTQLAIDVRLPSNNFGGAPFPTLIEYAGYGYADPAGPQSGISQLANLMGIAVVDVNMRGTGCSGGAFDYFEPLQNLDGYDVIETIAHQPWVLGNKVGMMGVSYGAISQLFTAQLDPPDLEAISPLSTIDATATTLYPGGILNTGFAVQWAEGRQHDAEPAGPNTGEPYAYKQIQQGDQTCAANQVMHGEAADLMARIQANALYNPAMADPLDPDTFVNNIHVPVFLACQFEDEQTGGHCPDLVQHFTGTNQKWFTFTNGAHIDSLDPSTFNRWYDFLELFVAHRPPMLDNSLIRAAAPIIYGGALGTPSSDVVTLPSDPVQQISSYQGALAAFQAQPEVTVAFDNGAGPSPAGTSTPGSPYPAFTAGFSSLPVPGTTAKTWYLAPGGALSDNRPSRSGADTFTWNAQAQPLTDWSGGNTGGGGLWGDASQWTWNWVQNPPGIAVSYVSAPLTQNTAVVGAGAVHVWVRSSTPDVDLMATVSEVRPDGQETFVQNGWVRASERKLATGGTNNLLHQRSTLLDPVLSARPQDVRPMPQNKYVEVVIPLYYEGHVYRPGSRIRVTISAPNGTQPVWSFSQTVPTGTATESVAFSRSQPSSLILPVVPGVNVPTGLPPCPSLRNEPCRSYAPTNNQVAP